jgi:hypothetical protein
LSPHPSDRLEACLPNCGPLAALILPRKCPVMTPADETFASVAFAPMTCAFACKIGRRGGASPSVSTSRSASRLPRMSGRRSRSSHNPFLSVRGPRVRFAAPTARVSSGRLRAGCESGGGSAPSIRRIFSIPPSCARASRSRRAQTLHHPPSDSGSGNLLLHGPPVRHGFVPTYAA